MIQVFFLPACLHLRSHWGSYEPVSRFDQDIGKLVPVPIDPGPETDQVFLIVYGTGIRFRSALSAVTAGIGGLSAEVLFAGPQPDFVGLDQVNLRLSRFLAGRGDVDVIVVVDGKQTGPVRVNIK